MRDAGGLRRRIRRYQPMCLRISRSTRLVALVNDAPGRHDRSMRRRPRRGWGWRDGSTVVAATMSRKIQGAPLGSRPTLIKSKAGVLAYQGIRRPRRRRRYRRQGMSSRSLQACDLVPVG